MIQVKRMEQSSAVRLSGNIERITFHNPDNHFTIARLDTGQPLGMITILGHLPAPRPGEKVQLTGKWEKHPRYGQQFRFADFRMIQPADLESLERFLASGAIKGIGPKMARSLVQHFGEDIFRVLEKTPEELTRVKGIGPQSAEKIAESWNQRLAVRKLSQLLRSIGANPVHGARIFSLYGESWEQVLLKDPYRLADDWPRTGFRIAEALAKNIETQVPESRRAAACVCHLLETAADDGHTFIAYDDLLAACDARFGLDFHSLNTALDQLEQDSRLVRDTVDCTSVVYPALLHQAESELAGRLIARLGIAPDIPAGNQDPATTVVQRLAIKLSDEQLQALEGALQLPLAIITGGPGTGKTTLVRSLTAILEQRGKKVLLVAPTGRAARRLAETARHPAATIHKTLGYNLGAGTFERGPDDPLECDAVIVDEASMIDLSLMYHLVRAMPFSAQLILVGDKFQLPAIGPGNILSDLLDSGMVKSFELNTVFRQAAESSIITSAHKVRTGLMPDLPPWDPGHPRDFCFIERQTPEEVVRCVVQLCTGGLAGQRGIDPKRHIQVLVPMHRGIVGTVNLNRVLQSALNPGKQNKHTLPFRPGDKVMQLVNDYSKEVFNGDIGQVVSLDPQAQMLTVSYDHKNVTYDLAEIDNLSLAYAISVHKSQGSEYPVVILPLLTQHYVLLQRNLLYTAITRASKKVIIVGSAKAVQVAIRNNSSRKRMTALAWRLANR